MTSKISNYCLAGFVAGIIIVVVGLLGSFSETLKIILVGGGITAMVISTTHLREETEEPKDGLEVKEEGE
jgi:ABC-type enterobactin transport system permease subunit